MIAAAAMTPTSAPGGPDLPKPKGMNGLKFSGLKYGMVTATKTIRATTFRTTSRAFTVALSRVPRISRPATTRMMKMAGRFRIPPSSGPAASSGGIANWVSARNPVA